jgi:CRISPR/Cas system-associated exonuclease Cas4 (RecB family)
MAPRDLPRTTSASQLVAFSMCPRRYFFQYLTDLEPEFRSTSLVLGSAVHSSIEWHFTERMAGNAPTVDQVEAIFMADLLAATIDAPIRWKESTPDELEAEGRKLIRTYLMANGTLPVIAVEQGFEVPLVHPTTGELLGRPLKGYFDLMLEDRIVELKTSARGWSEFDLPRHLQVGAYCFASHVLFEALPTVEIQVLVKLKREPRVERFIVERNTQDLGWWLAAAAEIERAIEGGAFPPSPGPLCRECEYGRTCAMWTGQPHVAPEPRSLFVLRGEGRLEASP